MSPPRLASLFSHLSLTLAGLALTSASLDFIPEMPIFFLAYASLVMLDWYSGGRYRLEEWGANVLAVVLTLVGIIWIVLRLRSSQAMLLLRDIPIPVAIVPYLGPLLMALAVVRLYRPTSIRDFWMLQGLGLLQVALGCVLSSGTLFGLFLLLFLFSGICAMAAQERLRQQTRSASMPQIEPPWTLGQWIRFGLRWAMGISLVALPLFLLTPRVQNAEWDPTNRFGFLHLSGKARTGETGFSDEIDLNRTGKLALDDSQAFTVHVVNHQDRSENALQSDQRWRGIVLDRYENGIWRSDISWPATTPIPQPLLGRYDPSPDTFLIEFRVSSKLGGLFLADPLLLDPRTKLMPILLSNLQGRATQFFFEGGGTVVPFANLTSSEFRYTQIMPRSIQADRIPAIRVRDSYIQKMLRGKPAGLEEFTRKVLLGLLPPDQKPGTLRHALRIREQTGELLHPTYWNQIAMLLTRYLARSGEFTYSLNHERRDLSVDPVLDFLTNVRSGTCERYASALALMLRSQGVPARVVKGYRGIDRISEGYYQVRQSHAHAWVEALAHPPDEKTLSFDWVAIDPTPDLDDPVTPLAAWQQWTQTSKASWQDLILGYNSQQQADLLRDIGSPSAWLKFAPWVLGGLLLGSLLFLLRWRRKTALRDKSLPPARTLFEQYLRTLKKRWNLVPEPGETPQEMAHRVSAFLAPQDRFKELADIPMQVVRLHYSFRFGGEAPGDGELTHLRHQLERLEHGQ